ncbi:Coiled-coil domain-containing protein 43 [Holothuria leucospilota]|uniref:Coiled-coil domain-containing protein 43 n=1 Tax=Holothuria leucospilota TaxID=206669 RepID=A0A9Q1BA28_HOLLE|nr:Coiled-coil domain-containing protein 43 [Holothuria leucospilota]
MAASMAAPDFESWISTKLQSLNVDDEVFGNYIISLLDTEDTSREEKIEAISGILVEVENPPVEEICEDILRQWDQCQEKQESKEQVKPVSTSETTMSSIMEKHATAVVKKELTKEQKAEKAAVLAMYAQVSEEEEYPFFILVNNMLPEGFVLTFQYGSGPPPIVLNHTPKRLDDDADAEDSSAGKSSGVFNVERNTNAESVLKLQKEQRDRAKQEYEKKKEQDKEQRAKEKQKAQDRKEKEKKRTQKQERRR